MQASVSAGSSNSIYIFSIWQCRTYKTMGTPGQVHSQAGTWDIGIFEKHHDMMYRRDELLQLRITTTYKDVATKSQKDFKIDISRGSQTYFTCRSTRWVDGLMKKLKPTLETIPIGGSEAEERVMSETGSLELYPYYKLLICVAGQICFQAKMRLLTFTSEV